MLNKLNLYQLNNTKILIKNFFRIFAKKNKPNTQKTMKSLLVIASLAFLIDSSFAMKADDICFLKKSDLGTMMKCEGNYWYQCGAEHCSVDKTSCKNYLYSSFIVKSMRLLKTYEKKSENVMMFLDGIKECPSITSNDEIDACKKGK